ncbi:hypothetical protein BJ742DRAFT_818495 [Cladochytrium replicatum]|nr:hypothetical protein BJ742DRAFT_818495 [Cladochytrium replicatum]
MPAMSTSGQTHHSDDSHGSMPVQDRQHSLLGTLGLPPGMDRSPTAVFVDGFGVVEDISSGQSTDFQPTQVSAAATIAAAPQHQRRMSVYIEDPPVASAQTIVNFINANESRRASVVGDSRRASVGGDHPRKIGILEPHGVGRRASVVGGDAHRSDDRRSSVPIVEEQGMSANVEKDIPRTSVAQQGGEDHGTGHLLKGSEHPAGGVAVSKWKALSMRNKPKEDDHVEKSVSEGDDHLTEHSDNGDEEDAEDDHGDVHATPETRPSEHHNAHHHHHRHCRARLRGKAKWKQTFDTLKVFGVLRNITQLADDIRKGFHDPNAGRRRPTTEDPVLQETSKAAKKFRGKPGVITQLKAGESIGDLVESTFIAERIGFNLEDYRANIHRRRFAWRLSSHIREVLNKEVDDYTESDITELYKLISTMPAFAKYDLQVRQALCRVIKYQVFPANRVIVKQGHEAQSFFFIMNGTVQVKKQVGGEVLDLSVLRSGDSFGELALLNNVRRAATIITLEETEFLVVHRNDFAEVLRAEAERDLEDKISFLHSTPLFSYLSREKLTNLALTSHTREYPANQVLVTEGEIPQHVMLIRDGKCRMLKTVKFEIRTGPKDTRWDELSGATRKPKRLYSIEPKAEQKDVQKGRKHKAVKDRTVLPAISKTSLVEHPNAAKKSRNTKEPTTAVVALPKLGNAPPLPLQKRHDSRSLSSSTSIPTVVVHEPADSEMNSIRDVPIQSDPPREVERSVDQTETNNSSTKTVTRILKVCDVEKGFYCNEAAALVGISCQYSKTLLKILVREALGLPKFFVSLTFPLDCYSRCAARQYPLLRMCAHNVCSSIAPSLLDIQPRKCSR